MKVHAITKFIDPYDAGVAGLFTRREVAEEHFATMVRETAHPDASNEEVEIVVQAALKSGFHRYSGDGTGSDLWYRLSEEEVQ